MLTGGCVCEFARMCVCVSVLWVLRGIKIWKKQRLWLAAADARCDELKVLLTFDGVNDTYAEGR